MAEAKKILILTDSRGKRLDELLFRHFKKRSDLRLYIQVRVYAGATLGNIRDKIARLRKNQDLIIVLAGICNFTQKEKLNNKKLLTYPEGTNKLEKAVEEVDNLITKTCLVATITPASLEAYAKQNNREESSLPDQSTDQRRLFEDLDKINLHIKGTSKDREAQIINLAKLAFKNSRKKRGKKHKTIYNFEKKELPDGVHLSKVLRKSWARNIAVAIEKFFEKKPVKHTQETTDSSEEEEQKDTGNFKRAANK